MIGRASGVGIWVITVSTLTAQAGGARIPVEAPTPVRQSGGPLLYRPVEAPVELGPNSGGPGTTGDEKGKPAPAAEPEGTVGSKIPEVREGVGGIWVPEAATGDRPI